MLPHNPIAQNGFCSCSHSSVSVRLAKPKSMSFFPLLAHTTQVILMAYGVLITVEQKIEGFNPVKLYADDKFVRAWPGGNGNTKIGGNYGSTIMPQMEANKKGYSQV